MTVCIFHDYVCIFNHDCVFLIMTVCIFHDYVCIFNHDCVCILGMGFRRVPVMDDMYRVEGDPAC
jgi:hypothetical protein